MSMNNPFEYVPDRACEEAFSELVDRLEALKGSEHPDDVNFCRELESGKMLGVLIAHDDEGRQHTLYAFSGQLGSGGFYRKGFVGPMFDYLQPDGYFKTKEREITNQNCEIDRFENEEFAALRHEYAKAIECADAEVAAYKEKCRLSKSERDAKRESGQCSEQEMAAMIRESQFEKGELRRIKKRISNEIAPLAEKVREGEQRLQFMKEKRKAASESLQRWLFDNFRLMNANGETRSLTAIFAETPMKIPPSGAGECCAPKLLYAAYTQGLHPQAMAEYWYGKPKEGEVRIHGEHYPACRGKCLPVLGWMLQGLTVTPPLNGLNIEDAEYLPEVVYENEWFCIVDKPSGMLSVPGKGEAVSTQQWLEERYGSGRSVRPVHRLDRDTSGLLIATFGEEAYKIMQSLFAGRKVKKEYIAELEGDYLLQGIACEGVVDLPLSPDWLDRPRQRVDPENGKEAVTDYEFIGVTKGRSRVAFYPRTGRTHQLRVHAASDLGLGMPIVGDRLYGKNGGRVEQRLHLHARKIEFIFPMDNRKYCFESPVPF